MLTTRQLEVLRLIAEGKTVRDIGATLNISAKTVEFHKKALMDVTDMYFYEMHPVSRVIRTTRFFNDRSTLLLRGYLSPETGIHH